MSAVNAVGAQSGSDTERKLDRIKQELNSVARERRKLESQRGDVVKNLRQADEQVDQSLQALHATQTELQRERIALYALRLKRSTLQHDLGTQRQELASLLRAAYAIGEDAPLKVLLAQDRIANANRMLTYHGYLQRQRTQRIALLTTRLSELNAIEQQIVLRQANLDRTSNLQRAQLSTVESDRASRAKMMSQLEQKYRDRSAREKALGRDAKGLEKLLTQLRAAARKAAIAKVEAAKAEAASRDSAQVVGSEAGKSPAKPAQVPKIPAMQVGGAGWPVSGALLAGFGARLPDGRTSTGMLIGAPAGTTVRAMADGKVVFSEWMTGYGMILIVDHGNGYMSLYAHNDALLRHTGDAIKRGDAIASVGNSGGQGRPGLYLELRHQGQPVNPQAWLQKR